MTEEKKTPEEESLIYLMSVPKGRFFLWQLLSKCHVFGSSFSAEIAVMSFTEGERNIGLRIFNDIMRLCPEQYLIMVRESQEVINNDDRSNTISDDRD